MTMGTVNTAAGAAREFTVGAVAVPTPRLSYLLTKRAIDLCVSIVMLLALVPLLAIVGLAVLADSGWPVLYRAPRVGRDRRIFKIVKFRSMVANADQSPHVELVHRLLRGDGSTGDELFKLTSDSRVTRVGGFLRRTSLDELPQLWNVLIGDMSLVGPRPEVTYSLDAYEPWMLRRFVATPGMTGLWQVSGRSRLGLRDMLRLDVEYVQERSLLLDARIMLLTVPAVFSTQDCA